jgi:hypothetical protein
MNITQVRYHKDFETQENVSVSCLINGIRYSVPLDPANRHYAEIMRQVESGDLVIQEAD